jgi:rubredoxin
VTPERRPPAEERGPPLDAAYECGACWAVYDPALGDPAVHVLPGTPFAALPPRWRCPRCGAPKARFLAVSE